MTIKENRADYGTHHNNLQAHLAAGSGTADIEVIEIGQIAGYLGQGDKFVNFNDQGVDPKQWSDAKIKQATATDGSLIGLGTDIGGLAICYRTDLFKAAGLPTDREAVGKLWPTWDDYVKAGSDFIAKTPDKKVKWYDGADHVMTGILAQQKNTFYDDNGDVIAGTNPVVKQAWDLAVKSIQAKQSAALAEFSPEWNTGCQQGQFATITCPAWMTAYIRNNAPETKGKWDIATVPGGSGNWGGSFLTVPKQGKHIAEAVDLAKYLTTPETAIEVFKKFGNYPSPVKTWAMPEVKDAKDAFFSDAPVGEIFPKSFANLPEQAAGPQSGVGSPAVAREPGRVGGPAYGRAVRHVCRRRRPPPRRPRPHLDDAQRALVFGLPGACLRRPRAGPPRSGTRLPRCPSPPARPRRRRHRAAVRPAGPRGGLAHAQPPPRPSGHRLARRRRGGPPHRRDHQPALPRSRPGVGLSGGCAEDVRDHSRFDVVRDGDLARIAVPIDSLGINYYNPTTVRADPAAPENPTYPGSAGVAFPRPTGPVTAMGWPVDPSSLTDLLVRIGTDAPGLPILVTENGAAYADHVDDDGRVRDGERSAYLLEHVRAVHAAIARGVDVRGYFAWSLLDNFEWSFGYDRRFGLVRVDYATQKRLPKESFWTYAALARAHAVPASGPVTTVADSPDFAHAPTGV